MRSFFFKEDGGKETLNFVHCGIVAIPCVLFLLFYGLLVPEQADTSFVVETSEKIKKPESETEEQARNEKKKNESRFSTEGGDYGAQAQSARKTRRGSAAPQKIKYDAKQVIERGGVDPENSLPVGTSFIGKLITAIDTRATNQFVKVLLPYGASFKNDRKIERNTVLIGTANYPGSGERVFINFVRGVLPNGKEFEIQAQALDPKDYTPGVLGEHHGNTMGRVTSVLALTGAAAFTDTLTEKEALSEAGMVTPKATWKNAGLQAASKVTEMEAQRHASRLGQEKDYVTLPSDSGVLISLTETFKGGFN